MRFGRSDGEVAAFVQARYPALARTAYLVCSDPDRASHLAISCLADVTAAGARSLEDGTPTADAWRALLTGLLATGTAPSAPGHSPSEATPGDVVGCLGQAYAALPVLARVALAASHVEGLTTAECAGAMGRPSREVEDEVAAARASLREVHDRARTVAGLDIAPGLLDADLEESLRRRADRAVLAPDPRPLLRRLRGARRRRAGLRASAGVAVLAVVAVVVILSGRGALGGTSPPAPSPTTAPPVALTRWLPRGELITDPTVLNAMAYWWGAEAHLLYAGDIGPTRIVVGWRPSSSTGLVQVTALAGTAGRDELSPFVEVGLPTTETALAFEAAAHDGTTPLLVLGPPGADDVRLSSYVSYQADGTVSRLWSTMRTRNGVGTARIRGSDHPALRVRIGTTDVAVLNTVMGYPSRTLALCPSCSTRAWRVAVADWGARRLAAATSVPVDQITSTVQAAGPVPPASTSSTSSASSGASEPTDLVCLHEHLPGGVLVQVTALRRTQHGGRASDVMLSVIPADGAQGRPCVMRVDRAAEGAERYAVAVPGARAVRVGDSASNLLDPSGFVLAPDGVAELTVPPSRGTGLAVASRQSRGGVEVWSFSDLTAVVDPFDPPRPGG